MLEDSQFSSPQVRTPLDTMMHLLPDAGQVIGEERLRNWHAMVFFALAFCEPWFSKFERSFSFFLATLHGFVRICFTPKDLFQNVSVTFLLQEMEDKAVAKVVAGDNAAESEFARSKNQLRRIGKLGRMSPKTSHIDVLAVRRLLERPGLATCVAALARYRKSRAGQLGHAPGDAYDITKDHAWLFD